MSQAVSGAERGDDGTPFASPSDRLPGRPDGGRRGDRAGLRRRHRGRRRPGDDRRRHRDVDLGRSPGAGGLADPSRPGNRRSAPCLPGSVSTWAPPRRRWPRTGPRPGSPAPPVPGCWSGSAATSPSPVSARQAAGGSPSPRTIAAGCPRRRLRRTVSITSGGLATSSTTVRRWRTSSGWAHHIVDPRTGGNPARVADRLGRRGQLCRRQRGGHRRDRARRGRPGMARHQGTARVVDRRQRFRESTVPAGRHRRKQPDGHPDPVVREPGDRRGVAGAVHRRDGARHSHCRPGRRSPPSRGRPCCGCTGRCR